MLNAERFWRRGLTLVGVKPLVLGETPADGFCDKRTVLLGDHPEVSC